MNITAIPAELRSLKQWVGWLYVQRDGEPKPTKVPVNARTGEYASTTMSTTWSSFDEAMRVFQCGVVNGTRVDGVGFVFNNDFVGIDLDNCCDPETGEIKEWAREILSQCRTYTEVSPSGTGLHLYVSGRLPEELKGNRKPYADGLVEIYCHKRFFTVTAEKLDGTPDHPEPCIEAVKAIHRKVFGNGNGTRHNGNGNSRQHSTPPASDRELVDKAMVADNGAKFRLLWNGDTSDYDGDESRADLALCCLLAFWTGKDAARIDGLFRQSGLMRQKWEREDYRKCTIDKAIDSVSETYTPKRETPKNGRAKRRSVSRIEPINETGKRKPDLDTASRAILANLNNAVQLIETDPKFCSVWFDEFLQRILTGDPAQEWTDADDIDLMLRFQRDKGISRMGRETASQAVVAVAFKNIKNCVKDWMESLRWDNEPRIDHFFEDHFGAEGNRYTRAASKNFWLSLIARVYRPGCQVDNMIVLEGKQGIGKSLALRTIGGEWFAEQHENVTKKDFFENLQGKLLIEISEMDSFKQAETTKVKQVITTTSDRFRESYGRKSADHPRQCVFAGTTNSDSWNRDETGARRFWPIACSDIDVEAIRVNRDQFFAEAVFRYKAAESWWEMPAEETQKQQADRYVPPAWVEPIRKYIENERVQELSIADVFGALDIPQGQWNKANEMRIAESLRYLGWTKKDVKRDGKTVKRWRVAT